MFSSEILEIIFSQLPLVDLLLTHSLVCKQWRDIIARPNFLPWKKCYYRYYLKDDATSKKQIEVVCCDNEISCTINCFSGMIRFFTNWKIRNPGPVLVQLSRHPLYNLSVKVFLERFPSVDIGTISPWGIVAMICLTSHNPRDIYGLFNLLIHSNLECPAVEVIEVLYCICTLLLYFNRTYKVPSKLHYNVHYALHLYENCWQFCSSRKSEKTLTHEQLKIVNHHIGPNDMIKIIALAGTGKTTTLVELTKRNPRTKFLVIVFNKSTQTHASHVFPRNVICKTAHSLAYGVIGRQYNTKDKRIASLAPAAIVDSYVLKGRENAGNIYRRARLVLDTLNSFMSSCDPFITIAHVPTKYRSSVEDEYKIVSDSERLGIANDSENVWNVICDAKDSRLPMPHDGYLKLWQLRQPNLVQSFGVRCILVDEGQDLSGAMLDVFRRQRCSRVIVGDPHQQIYQFRGAINALDRIEATHTYYLTQSFRFGPEISFLANSCLQVFKNMSNKCLVGGNVKDLLEESGSNVAGPVCVIGRTRLELYKNAVRLLCREAGNSKGSAPLRAYFAGGFESYKYEELIDLWYLRCGDLAKIKKNMIKKWTSYSKIKEYAEQSSDSELSASLAMVEWSGPKTEIYVTTMKKQTVDDPKLADVVFSTAHKSKGLEWHTVCLLDDFKPNLTEIPQQVDEESTAEYNLLYVGITRAKRRLVVNSACFYVLLHVNDKRERLVITEPLIARNPNEKCLCCRKTLTEAVCSVKALSVQVIPLRTSNYRMMGGILCSLCASLPIYNFPPCGPYCPPREMLGRADFSHISFHSLVGPSEDERENASWLYRPESLGSFFRLFPQITLPFDVNRRSDQ